MPDATFNAGVATAIGTAYNPGIIGPGQRIHYFSPTTPGNPSWDETLTSVSLAGKPGFIDYAELGQVGSGSIIIDDPAGTAGHNGDAILGLKQLYVTEGACPAGDQRVFTGYIAERRYGRSGAGALYTIGSGRAIDATILDANAILSFRLFKPFDLDPTSSFVRPAETDTERIAALLAVDFLSTTVYDEGFVVGADVDLDACDYTNQRPQAVLEDCSQQSGYNHFIRYHEDTGHLVLHYHDKDSTLDPADATISNVAADIDAGAFPPMMDWQLTIDPSRVVAGGILDYKAGKVIDEVIGTSYTYGYRDGYFQAPNVATSTQATARLARYLADNATEDERLTLTVEVEAADVTKIKAGQWLYVTLAGAPGFDTARPCRVLRRDVSQTEETDQFYTVRLELTPISPPPGIEQWSYTQVTWGTNVDGTSTYCRAELPAAPMPGNLLVAFCLRRDKSDVPFAVHSWVMAESGSGYDGTQYGGPGAIAYLSSWTRVAVESDTSFVAWIDRDDLGSGLADPVGVLLLEISNPATPVWTNDSGTVLPSGTVSATGGPADVGLLISAIGFQRTDYADLDYWVPTAGTELLDGAVATFVNNGAPGLWAGYAEGSVSLTVTAQKTFNAELDLWGYVVIGLLV